jgi:predicted enzyme related to lactoylglutathione lyase
MSLRLTNVTLDCSDAMRVARFWSEALGRPLDERSNEWFATIGRNDASQTSMFFAKVPEGKSGKNRVHLDLHADDRHAEIDRLIGLGAQRIADVEEYGHKWTVLQDVEGNEFCVA